MSQRRTRFSGVMALTLGAMLSAGCGGAEPGAEGSTGGEVPADYAGPVLSTDAGAGQLVYDQHCNGCHPGGQSGFGPAVAGIGTAPAPMRQQIREGSGRMPGFDETKISADELEQLLAYLVSVGGVQAPSGL